MEQISETIYQHYPKGVSPFDNNYNNTTEASLLITKMEESRSDSRRGAFVTCLHESLPDCSIYDRTCFCFASPCFHFIVYFYYHDTVYEILIYISFISPFWGYVINSHSISGEKELNKIVVDYWDLLLKMSRVERQDFFKNLKEEFFKNNPTKTPRSFLLEHDETASAVVDKIRTCQGKTFNYDMLPKTFAGIIIPGVATNQMSFGKATIFDCLFTDEYFK